MGKVSDYAFINAKLRARIGIMREERIPDELIKAPTLSEAIAHLDNTRYQHLAEVYRATGDLQQLELALVENEIASYKEVASYLHEKAAHLVSVMLEKIEIDNLKNALRIWYSSSVRGHLIADRAHYLEKGIIVHRIDYDRIVNASSFSEVVSALALSPYAAVLKRFADDSRNSSLFRAEIALDHLWFEHLYQAEKALDAEDRKIASGIFDVDVDLKNILFIVRYRYYYSIADEALREVIIPYGKIGKDIRKIDAFSVDGPSSDIRRIIARHYPAIVSEIEHIRALSDDLTSQAENASQILSIESYLAKTRETEYTHLLAGNPFNIGIVLAYFFLRRQEDSMIQAILSAKYYGWDEDRIREALNI